MKVHEQNINTPFRPWRLYGALFVVFLALYALTAQTGLSWQDSGEFQYRVLANDYFWHSGLARAHPLYILASGVFRLAFPPGLHLYGITLFSGLCMSVALVLLAMILWHLTRNGWGVLLAVSTLGLSHMAWWMSTIAEVYTGSLAFLMAEVFCLLKITTDDQRAPVDAWMMLGLINGLHASFHTFALLNLPVYGVLFCLTHRNRDLGVTIRHMIAILAAWFAGAFLLMGLFAVEWRTSGSFTDTLGSLLFGTGYEQVVLGTGPIRWSLALSNYGLACISLLSPCWLLLPFGWKTLRQQPLFKRCLLALTVLHGLFWIRYFVADQATFLLPTLGLLSIWLGLGIAQVRLTRKQQAGLFLAGLGCQILLPLLLCGFLMRHAETTRTRTLPFRNEWRYWLVPWKNNEHSAQQFVVEVQQMVHDGDVVISDSTSAGPLMAARQAQRHPAGWSLITPWSRETDGALNALLRDGGPRVFVVSPVSGYVSETVLKQAGGFVKEGVLYRMERRRPSASNP